MVQSKATTVDAYIDEAEPGRADALRRFREIAHRRLPNHLESMNWGMATYARDGRSDLAFANQKQYLALYVLKTDVVAAHAEAVAGIDHGKGCIRFRRADKIDWDLVELLIAATAAAEERPC